MANDNHREHFKQAMERIRSMSDDEFLERIRSHGSGEYGTAFRVPVEDVKFKSYVLPVHKKTVSLVWNEDDFVAIEIDNIEDAANELMYAHAA